VRSARFVNDPEMNWFGGLSTPIVTPDGYPPVNARQLKNLRVFLDSVNRSVLIAGGRVTVAVIQQDGEEKIVAFAAWVPPHKVIEDTLTVLRSKAYRTTVVFKPTIGPIVKQALKAKGYEGTDHYRLEITATDPEYQNQGYCRLLMDEGFAVAHSYSKPITLEATNEHSRDVYAHLGFEVSE
ncbi:hypothetical protein C8R46DRAFT_809430, partial [Mycena filopes]